MDKLTIHPEGSEDTFDKGRFEVLFNPNQINLDRSVCWRPAGISQSLGFTHGEPVNLSMDLFFDSYEQGGDVRDSTKKVVDLTRVGALGRPPRCRLSWGSYNFEDLTWVLTRVAQRYTLFHPNGWPARATLTCSFRQWRSPQEVKMDKPKPDVVKTHIVGSGETLSGIAAEAYGDPTRWRAIADANNLANPRRLAPGTTLTIPPLPPGGSLLR